MQKFELNNRLFYSEHQNIDGLKMELGLFYYAT